MTLSKLEAEKIISSQLNVTCSIEGLSVNCPPYERPSIELMKCLNIVRSFPDYEMRDKAEAIRQLRSYGDKIGVRIGLCDAKHFVESLHITP